jgi:hypothetical protein
MRVSSLALDGEAMCFGEDGSHDFDALWDNSRDETVTLCLFDLLELNGEDWRDNPLLERKCRLRRLLSKDRAGLRYVEHLKEDGHTVFEHACRLRRKAGSRSRTASTPGPLSYGRSMRLQTMPSRAIARVREAFERERIIVYPGSRLSCSVML